MNPRRPRLTLVVSESARPRSPLAAELSCFSSSQRSMLAMVLIEKLSMTEAALALGVGLEQFERAYHELIGRLRDAMTQPVPVAVPVAAVSRRAAVRLRKVS